ncbi:MAG: hypothetical protein IPN23_11025 [Elusimicrobia bacterium]|nr:hypothetical protein [Elusimicrobiota bacterium]
MAAALALVAPVAGYFAIQNVSPWFIGLVDRLPIFQGKYNGLRNLERQERNVALSGNLATWAERLLEGFRFGQTRKQVLCSSGKKGTDPIWSRREWG